MIDETRRGQLVKTITTIHWSHSVIPKGQTGTVLYDLDTGLNQHLVVVRWQDGNTGLVFAADIETIGSGAERRLSRHTTAGPSSLRELREPRIISAGSSFAALHGREFCLPRFRVHRRGQRSKPVSLRWI
jgi:hypothetical protein